MDGKQNAQNAESLDTIQRGLFVLCLDQGHPNPGSEHLKITLTGGGSAVETANRWFDKLQLVVSANGEVRLAMYCMV